MIIQTSINIKQGTVMLDIWTQRSGYSFGIIEERSTVDLPLPVTYSNGFSDSSSTTFNLISGELPPGLRLINDSIIGSPNEVPRTTEFTFVIRATYNNDLSDRTFKITIDGADVPVFNTPEGSLPVGPNNAYFVLDSSLIDFQLDVTDTDTATGQILKCFISSGDGELPPGLTLSDSGRITGFINPIIAIPAEERDGSFDSVVYDAYGYDFGQKPDNGYDSFLYDTVLYDFFFPNKSPNKLNRNYEFIVSVSDGDSISKRKFKIYVVGDDFLRADNTLASAGNGVYTADGTYLRTPIWVTDSDLGVHRANNYITIFLDTYDADVLGPIIYSLDATNPGTYRLNSTGETASGYYELTGEFPYFPESNIQTTNINQWSVITPETTSQLPPDMQIDLGRSEIFGVVPYQPAITRTYQFTVSATRFGEDGEIAVSKRTFSISTLGEVDSTMTWLTPSSLGEIDANYISTLKVEATTTVENSTLLYTLQSGNLPPGLTLQLNGELTGKVNQYSDVDNLGMTTFSDGGFTNQIYDNGITTFDREFKFVVRAKDQFEYSRIDRQFSLIINTPNDRLYSNISARTFMNQEKRSLFNGFIDNNLIFTPESIYRPNDPNFGIQRDLKMTIYPGIETKTAAQYVSAMGLNHKKKKFIFGDVKSAKAKITGTNTVVYEVIYVEMIDSLQKGNIKLDSVLANLKSGVTPVTVDSDNSIWDSKENLTRLNRDEPYAPRPLNRITVDQTNIISSDPNYRKRYPSSIGNWRTQLATVGQTERNYLPLWMRSIQDDAKQELGFVLAVPICYCRPGYSDEILLNIKFSGFDFKNLDYTVDRYIIDSMIGYNGDKYLLFKDDKVTI